MNPLGLVKARKCDIAIGGAFICKEGIEIAFVFKNNRTDSVKASVCDIKVNGKEVSSCGGHCTVFQTGSFVLRSIVELLCNENQIVDITYKYNLRYKGSNNYFIKTEQIKLQSEYIRHLYSSEYKTKLVQVFSNAIWDIKYVGALVINDNEKLMFLAKNKSLSKQLFSFIEMNVDGITMPINFSGINVAAGEMKLDFIEPDNAFKYDISNKVVKLKATNTYNTILDEEDTEYICEEICIGRVYDEMYACTFEQQELQPCHNTYFNAGIENVTKYGVIKISKVIDCSEESGESYELECSFIPKVTGVVEFRIIVNGFTIAKESIECEIDKEKEFTISLLTKWLRIHGFSYEESYPMTFKVALINEHNSDLEIVEETNYIFKMNELIKQSEKTEDYTQWLISKIKKTCR